MYVTNTENKLYIDQKLKRIPLLQILVVDSFFVPESLMFRRRYDSRILQQFFSTIYKLSTWKTTGTYCTC